MPSGDSAGAGPDVPPTWEPELREGSAWPEGAQHCRWAVLSGCGAQPWGRSKLGRVLLLRLPGDSSTLVSAALPSRVGPAVGWDRPPLSCPSTELSSPHLCPLLCLSLCPDWCLRGGPHPLLHHPSVPVLLGLRLSLSLSLPLSSCSCFSPGTRASGILPLGSLVGSVLVRNLLCGRSVTLESLRWLGACPDRLWAWVLHSLGLFSESVKWGLAGSPPPSPAQRTLPPTRAPRTVGHTRRRPRGAQGVGTSEARRAHPAALSRLLPAVTLEAASAVLCPLHS